MKMQYMPHLIAVTALTFSPLTIAEKPTDKPPVSEDVMTRLAELEARLTSVESLAKRLSGYTAAVIERDEGGSRAAAPGSGSETNLSLYFCPNGVGGDCDGNTPEAYTLTTGFFDQTSENATFSFDANTAPDFEAIVALLTNGDGGDRVSFRRETCVDTCGGSGLTSPDYNLFFRTQQPSTGVGFNDLEGLDIGRISIVIDRYTEFYNQTDMRVEYDLKYRIFFEVER